MHRISNVKGKAFPFLHLQQHNIILKILPSNSEIEADETHNILLDVRSVATPYNLSMHYFSPLSLEYSIKYICIQLYEITK